MNDVFGLVAIGDALDGAYTITATASKLGIKPCKLIAWLKYHRWMYQRGGELHAYQQQARAGQVVSKIVPLASGDGDAFDHVGWCPLITPQGMAELAAAFGVELEAVA